jgi:NADH-quinone oxidoreductase chain I
MAVDERNLDQARKRGFGLGLLKGMGVTLKHLFKHNTVIQYPDEKQDLSPRTRGVIALKEENCTVCMLCARECPDWCIYIDSHKETLPPKREGGRPRKRNVLDRFAIDYALCMYCGICVEVCPYDALFWSREFEYAEYDIRELTHEKEKLSDWMATVLPPPALEEGAEYPGAPRREQAPSAQAATPTVTSQPDAADEAGGTAERAGAPVAPAGTAGAPAGGGAPKEPMPDVGPVPGRQAEAAPSPGGGEEKKEAAEAQGPAGQPVTESSSETPSVSDASGKPSTSQAQTEPSTSQAQTEPSTSQAQTEPSTSQAQGEPSTSQAQAGEGPAKTTEAEEKTPVAEDLGQSAGGGPSADEVARLQETPGPNVEVPHEDPRPAALEHTEDPEEAYRQVLEEQQAKGVSPQVAEARAKVARLKAERGIQRSGSHSPPENENP